MTNRCGKPAISGCPTVFDEPAVVTVASTVPATRTFGVKTPNAMKYVPARSGGVDWGVITIVSSPVSPSEEWSACTAPLLTRGTSAALTYRSTSTPGVVVRILTSSRVAPAGTEIWYALSEVNNVGLLTGSSEYALGAPEVSVRFPPAGGGVVPPPVTVAVNRAEILVFAVKTARLIK